MSSVPSFRIPEVIDNARVYPYSARAFQEPKNDKRPSLVPVRCSISLLKIECPVTTSIPRPARDYSLESKVDFRAIRAMKHGPHNDAGQDALLCIRLRH